MKIFIIASLFLSLTISLNAQEFNLVKDKRVKKIKILSSTDKDIDKIFGRHIPFNEPIKVKGGVLNILYSFGKCSESDLSKWDVPNNIVVGVDFYPSKEIKIDFLKLDFTNYKQSFDSNHDLPLFSYSNDILGIKYVINKGANPIGYLHSVEYYPSYKFKDLKCKES